MHLTARTIRFKHRAEFMEPRCLYKHNNKPLGVIVEAERVFLRVIWLPRAVVRVEFPRTRTDHVQTHYPLKIRNSAHQNKPIPQQRSFCSQYGFIGCPVSRWALEKSDDALSVSCIANMTTYLPTKTEELGQTRRSLVYFDLYVCQSSYTSAENRDFMSSIW